MRLCHNRGHPHYAYQVFTDVPLLRWDNADPGGSVGRIRSPRHLSASPSRYRRIRAPLTTDRRPDPRHRDRSRRRGVIPGRVEGQGSPLKTRSGAREQLGWTRLQASAAAPGMRRPSPEQVARAPREPTDCAVQDNHRVLLEFVASSEAARADWSFSLGGGRDEASTACQRQQGLMR